MESSDMTRPPDPVYREPIVTSRFHPGQLRLGAVIAVALAAGFLVWLLVIRDSGSSGGSGPAAKAGAGPQAATSSSLVNLQNEVGHPVYWAGDQPNTNLEVTNEKDGRVYVRYLTGDAQIGDPKPSFLTIGTYPVKGAIRALQKQEGKPGEKIIHCSGGALIATNENSPTSVYVAYPGQDWQIEVYDPDAAKALSLATSGDIQPVG